MSSVDLQRVQIIDLMNSSSARCKWGYKQSEFAGLGGKVSYPEMQINKLIQINAHNRHNIKLYISPTPFVNDMKLEFLKHQGEL